MKLYVINIWKNWISVLIINTENKVNKFFFFFLLNSQILITKLLKSKDDLKYKLYKKYSKIKQL